MVSTTVRRVAPVVVTLVALLVSVGAWELPSTEPQGTTKPAVPDDLDAVMARVAQYVAEYGARVATVISTERYTQQISRDQRALPPRKLLAEFAMVHAGGEWHGFRDVFEVDGKPVKDREDRLLKLLTSGAADAIERGRAIADESARHNVGVIVRNFNTPTMALAFLTAENQPRLRFTRKRIESNRGRTEWKIEFLEVTRPTIIRTPAGLDMPAEGTVWVDPKDGTVLKTTFQLMGGTGVRFEPNMTKETDLLERGFRTGEATADPQQILGHGSL